MDVLKATVKETGSSISLMHSLDGSIKGLESLDVNESGPTLSLFDHQLFSTTIGSTGMTNRSTGVDTETSAASIVVFGKGGHHILWRAPEQ
jgi:hypothetical protein